MRIWLLILFFPLAINAQVQVKGKVLDAQTKQPLENVTIVEQNSKKWKITGQDGAFSFQFKTATPVSLKFRLLGKQEETLYLSSKELEETQKVYLKDKNLRLEEVIIQGKKQDYSEISLGEEAINQVQAFSVNEVLQQLPGQDITNFTLNEFKPIAFRTVKPNFASDEGFGNKSFGTALVIDDIPVSNNANMQSFAPSFLSPFNSGALGFGDRNAGSSFNGKFNNVNFGADLRQLSTQNIEKIEVVQGIPSAKYGDLTSGLIKIDQKAGKSPFLVYASLREGTTEYGINKGFRLSEKAGFLNVSASLLNSQANPRVSYTDYERINTQLIWSWANQPKSIRNSFTVKYGFNADNVQYDEENTDQKRVKNQQKDLSISNRFKYRFTKDAFLDHLEVNANLSISDQYSFESKLANNGGKVVGFGTEEGVYEGIYTAPTYVAKKEVEGKPINVYAAADVYKSLALQDWTHNFSAGISYRMSDNKGRGRIGSPESTAQVLNNQVGNGGLGFRPYNYADEVKAESQFSVYVEDEFYTYWEDSKINITAGLRSDVQNDYFTLSPRINAYYIYKKLKLRGGFGLTAKAPSLNQIYTGLRYYDVVLGDFRVPGEYNIGVVQTFVEKENNPNVKPSRSLRSEIGFDYKFSFATLNVTGFYNRLYDGITSSKYPIRRDLAEVEIDDTDLSNPEVVINGYRPYFYTESQVSNDFESEDFGVELFLNFPKFLFKDLSFGLQGSYTLTKNKNTADRFVKSSSGSKPERFGVYRYGGKDFASLKVGGNLDYHIPAIGLIIAIRSEHFILDKYSVNSSLYPYAYINEDLEKVLIAPENQSNTDLYGHIIKSSSRYENNNNKVFHNFHLRISKDFLNGFRFSFYANNFLDLKPTRIERQNGEDIRIINPDMVQLSFGTKIEYQF